MYIHCTIHTCWRRIHQIVGSMQRKCSISMLLFFVQHFTLCVTFSFTLSPVFACTRERSFSINSISSFIMHTTHMCSLAIPAYETIRMTTTYTNCMCVCVCRRLTKQKFKYHLRLKWKAGWQQQHHHCCHNVFVMKNMRWNGMVQQIELKMEYAVWIIDTVFLWPRYFFFINASFLWHLLSPNCLEMRGNGIALWNTHANLVWWTFRFYNNRVE